MEGSVSSVAIVVVVVLKDTADRQLLENTKFISQIWNTVL